MPSKLPRPPLHAALSRPLGGLRTGALTVVICAAVVLAPAVATLLRRPHGALSASASPAAGAAMWDGTRRGASERPTRQGQAARRAPAPRRGAATHARGAVRASASSPQPLAAAPRPAPRGFTKPTPPAASAPRPVATAPHRPAKLAPQPQPAATAPPPTSAPAPTTRIGARSRTWEAEDEHESQPSTPTENSRERGGD
jgi:hypothetical protein